MMAVSALGAMSAVQRPGCCKSGPNAADSRSPSDDESNSAVRDHDLQAKRLDHELPDSLCERLPEYTTALEQDQVLGIPTLRSDYYSVRLVLQECEQGWERILTSLRHGQRLMWEMSALIFYLTDRLLGAGMASVNGHPAARLQGS